MTRFDANGFGWSTLPPTWHDPRTAAEGSRQSPEANGASPGAPAVRPAATSPAAGRAVALDVLGYVVLIGGLMALVQLMGWAMSLVGAP